MRSGKSGAALFGGKTRGPAKHYYTIHDVADLELPDHGIVRTGPCANVQVVGGWASGHAERRPRCGLGRCRWTRARGAWSGRPGLRLWRSGSGRWTPGRWCGGWAYVGGCGVSGHPRTYGLATAVVPATEAAYGQRRGE